MAARENLKRAKTASTFYGQQVRARALRNAKRYDWAQQLQQTAIEQAKPWIEQSDDDLWHLIFSHDVFRSLAVNLDRGCPNCGKGIYQGRAPHAWPWIRWVAGHRWKMQCPNCGELFPKNDFEAFYKSGISAEDGFFHHDLADRSLLFNADHPDPKDPRHQWCVDDGRGWQRVPGGPKERDWFIANHAGFGLWQQISQAIRSLADAYALTSKPVYAHKCTILLDRLADEFPNYDGEKQLFAPQSGGFWPGIIGPNYWAGAMWSQRAIDFDKIYDGIGKTPETLQFLRAKSRRYKTPLPKQTIEDIKRNIEQRILVEPMRHRDRIDMNGASTKIAMATVQMVRGGRESIQEVIKEYLPIVVPDRHLNHDGSGNERSTGYDGTNFSNYSELLDRMYRLDPELARAVLQEQPKLLAGFRFWVDVWCLGKFIPNIGDTRSPGARSRPPIEAGAWLALFDITGDPRFAQMAVASVAGETSKLGHNIFAEKPGVLVKRTVEAAEEAGVLKTPSVVKRDYKLAILRSGTRKRRMALWVYYSPARGTSSHSHFDALNFGLFAHGVEMVCEQGYPLYTGGYPARWNWTSHTRSHATVVVDGQCQEQGNGGRLLAFAGQEGIQVISVEAPGVPYPQASIYRRTMILVETRKGESFAVDVFRVRGGREHTYTIPLYYGDQMVHGLELRSHPDVYDGYLSKVRAATPDSAWYVDTLIRDGWQGEPRAHLRVHGIPGVGTTVLLAQGESRNGKDAEDRLPCILLRRRGENLDSTFVVAYEPYLKIPFLPDRPLIATVNGEQVSVKVKGGYSFTIREGASVEVERDAGRAFTLSGTSGPS